jgi:hypothetical protein
MNELTLYSQVPAHVTKTNNSVFLAGLPQGGGFPTIGLNGTRFVIKAEGVSTQVPSIEIDAVLVGAKDTVDRSFYVGKFDPTQTEAKAPDCSSDNGIRPNADSPLKQCDSCAGCPMNQFGSGTDQNGNPGKGKACKETKRIAVFVNGTAYGFKIPPSSLKPFRQYVTDFTRQTGGADLSDAITTIGFDPNFSYPVLSFKLKGWLNAEQSQKIKQIKASSEVADIVGGTAEIISPAAAAAPVAAPADPFAQTVTATPVIEKPKVVRVAKEKPVEKPVEEDVDLAALALELGL